MSKLIGQAIKEINSTAEFYAENYDVNSIEWLNGTAPINVADIQTKISELEQAEQQAKAQKEADALAGNNKLLELGLTQAQVTAMTGYTPPTEV
jgi:hypothetical protein